MSIKIEKIYNSGSKCMEYNCPWQIPSSVFHLDICLTKDDRVLEIGSGGSTFFFASRCGHVTSAETDSGWANEVREKLKQEGVTNVSYYSDTTQKGVLDYIQNCSDDISVLSIDAHHDYNRSAFLDMALNHFSGVTTIVLDNFADTMMFPNHHHLSLQEWFTLLNRYNGCKWCGADHEDGTWSGRGTRILTCVQPYLEKD